MKTYYYVGILNENGDRGSNLRFVTNCDFVTKNWSYDVKSAPLAMNKVQAEDLALALMMNGISAMLVKSFTPVTRQIGHGYMHDNLVATLGLRAGYMLYRRPFASVPGVHDESKVQRRCHSGDGKILRSRLRSQISFHI